MRLRLQPAEKLSPHIQITRIFRGSQIRRARELAFRRPFMPRPLYDNVACMEPYHFRELYSSGNQFDNLRAGFTFTRVDAVKVELDRMRHGLRAAL